MMCNLQAQRLVLFDFLVFIEVSAIQLDIQRVTFSISQFTAVVESAYTYELRYLRYN